MTIFQNYKLRFNLTNYNQQNFSNLQSFYSIELDSTEIENYYVMQLDSPIILIYDKLWNLKNYFSLNGKRTFTFNFYNYLYVSAANWGILKYDKYFNLIKSNSRSLWYRGIYYNYTNGLINVASYDTKIGVDIFDQNLTLVGNISTSGINPYSLTEYNGMLVVSDFKSGKITFFKNSTRVKTVNTLCTNVFTILIDSLNNYMSLLCKPNIYLYHINGSFTGIVLTTCSSPSFMKFDSFGRLIVTCSSEIDILY